MRKVAKGDYNYKTEPPSHGPKSEMYDLWSSFNQMVQNKSTETLHSDLFPSSTEFKLLAASPVMQHFADDTLNMRAMRIY